MRVRLPTHFSIPLLTEPISMSFPSLTATAFADGFLLFTMYILMVHLYPIDVLKQLNVSSSFKVHIDSVIPASLAGVFLHSTPVPSLYFNPP